MVSRCSCSKCRLTKYSGPSDIILHFYHNGFVPSYWIWTEHGEIDEEGFNRNAPTTMRDQVRRRVCATNRNVHAEEVQIMNQNLQDMGRQLHETDEHYQAHLAELNEKAALHDEYVEFLKRQLRGMSYNLFRRCGSKMVHTRSRCAQEHHPQLEVVHHQQQLR
ncbi:hypothetical protein PIB30_057683 [Stylosanthes scabra]|uniref:Transposase-associated domain-containing protein n=1 Tax=Stylosanthes scabra TaxID=79078 RepID=A0ABU6TLD4_9FABA|nr:hypothetical protein [Stylosanthes scabra]